MGDSPLAALSDGIHGAELDRRISEAGDAVRRHLEREPSLGAPRLAAVLGSGHAGVRVVRTIAVAQPQAGPATRES